MIVLSKTECQQKLSTLVDVEGFAGVQPMLEAAMSDNICPAICVSPDCSYTEELESDQREGWCEHCQMNTMQSVLVLAGLI